MFLQKFSNIDWVRENARQNFANGRDVFGNDLPSPGWPNAILNVKSSFTERDNIKGPFSLFYNLDGTSHIGLDNKWYTVSNTFYCISNNEQPFNLHIPKSPNTTTFNIHFGEALFRDVIAQKFFKQSHLLDNFGYEDEHNFEILPKTEFISDQVKNKIKFLKSYHEQYGYDYSVDREYELLSSILEVLINNHLGKLTYLDRVSAQKVSTRRELFKRVNIAIDYIHSADLKNTDLNNISRVCGLSKFHFIRVFKEIYGQSPVSYINQLKVVKAQRLLACSEYSLSTIAVKLGFSELSAFTRFYKRMTKAIPSAMRTII